MQTVAQQYLAAPLQPPFRSLVHSLNPGAGKQEVYLSEQSVNKCDFSLHLMIVLKWGDFHPRNWSCVSTDSGGYK